MLAVLSATSQGIARKLRHPRHSRAAEPDASVAQPGPGPSPNLRPRGPVSIWDLASWGHLWHPSCRQQPFHATPPFPPAPLNPSSLHRPQAPGPLPRLRAFVTAASSLLSTNFYLSSGRSLQQSTTGRGLIDTRHSFLTVPEAGTSEIRLTPGRGLVSALFWSTDGHLTEFSRGRGRERGMEGRRKGGGRRQSSLSGVPVIRVPLHHQSPLRTWSPPKCPTSKHHHIGG